jgi:hypothetical protein
LDMSRSKNTVRKSSEPGSKMGTSMTHPSLVISNSSTTRTGRKNIEDWLISLQGDSRARISATQEDSEGLKKALDPGFGSRCSEPLAQYDLNTCFWKTCQQSFLTELTSFSEAFPKSGTMRNGTLYPLQTRVRPISGNGGGAGALTETKWPTPISNDAKKASPKSKHFQGLVDKVNRVEEKRWPTPTSTERSGINPNTGRGAGLSKTVSQRWPTPRVSGQENYQTRARRKGHAIAMSYLESAVDYTENPSQPKWPTPTTSQYKGWSPGHNRADTDDRLDYTVEREGYQQQRKGAKLNPDWVGWLMGVPIGWESLEPLPPENFNEWLNCQRDGTWWDEEKGLPRVDVDITDRASRLKALGNGIVPQCIMLFINQIIKERG